MSPRRSGATRASCLLLAALLPGSPLGSRAATFTVTSLADSGPGSLREAIDLANGAAGADVIDFALPDDSQINLLSSLPDITEQLEIDGSTAVNLQIQGTGAVPLFRVDMERTLVRDLELDDGDLEIGAGSTLAFAESGSETFDSDIVDLGELEKLGAGDLTLNGTNSYAGGTTILAGTLIGDTDSLPGNILNDAALVFDQDSMGTATGVISGTGSLEKRGSGVLVLTGANTYSGTTRITEGTLQADSSALPPTGAISIADGAALVFDETTPGAFAGVISGAGDVTKQGSETLILSGANEYTGGTTVSGGTLQINEASSLPGDVVNDAVLSFNQAVADGSFGGVVSGTGSVTKLGSRTLTLTGVNSYTGGTTVAAGTLRGSATSLTGDIAVDPGARLLFDQAGAGSFAGILSGTGDVEKTGAGTLRLTGANTHTGLTTVSGGRLEVDSTVAGNLQVQATGSLGGTSGLIGGNLTTQGAVAPGTVGAISELTILGDVTFQSGSIFEVDLNEAGAADALIVIGNATVSGATLVPRLAPGDYLSPLSLNILSAAAVTGDFAIDSLAFFDTELEPIPGGLNLLVDFSGAKALSLSQTPNQRAVAPAATALLQSGSSDPGVAALGNLRDAELPAALDALGGEQLTQFPTTHFAIAQRFNRTIQERIRSLPGTARQALFGSRSTSGGLRRLARAPGLRPDPVSASSAVSASSGLAAASALGALRAALADRGAGETGWGAWFDGFATLGDLDEDSGSSELDYTIWGTSLGLDYRFSERFLVGAGIGYANTDLDFDDRPGDNEADTYQGALYAGYTTPLYYVGIAGRYAFSDHDTSRDIELPGFSAQADADFDGDEYGAHLQAGVNAFDFGSLALQLIGSADYVHLDTDGYTESGAGAFNLRVEDETTDSLLLGVGARLHGAFEIDEELWLAPELRAHWLYEAGDEERRINARFADLGAGNAFTVESVDAPSSSVVVGLGWSVTAGEDLSVFLDYDATLNSDQVEHSAAFGVRLVW